MKNSTKDTTGNMLDQYPDVLTVEEVAGILRVSRSTVYDMIHDNEFPYVKCRNAYRISKKGLIDFLTSN